MLVRKVPKNSEDSSFSNELALLKFLRNQKCPQIASYYLSCSITNPAFNNGIYLQYYQGNLALNCRLYRQRDLLRISRQVLQAVHFLGENRVLHRDLKELNVLIDQAGNARLIDFGSGSGFHGNGPGQFTAASNRRTALPTQ
jgi:serine/threonine protein kinase